MRWVSPLFTVMAVLLASWMVGVMSLMTTVTGTVLVSAPLVTWTSKVSGWRPDTVGQQTAALRQYETCERVLMEELGASPSERTRDLPRAIREGQVPEPYTHPPVMVAVPEVQCPACHADNVEGARYCMRCGARLGLVCPQCGAELPAGAEIRFCVACGTPVAAQPSAASDSIPERLQRVNAVFLGKKP